ncbi:acyl carrier protein [Streptomyces sp. MST-110588]|uniref:acyl carrier protein n=1 Tax=Streptomyces sp. MST-110588 TaxID=2833628 RepID=UPI001F5C9B60|nr:acyl carrier protein [Streptomyces sp. MST-110588]UNO41801.1 hypothetical protein KGS77_22460 [Streptomyces sp. MST-110588]
MSGGLFDGLENGEDGAGPPRNAPGGIRDELYEDSTGRLDEDPVIARAKVILADVLRCDVSGLYPDADLAKDLGADEKAVTHVATLLERELDLDGLTEEADFWATVEDILTSVREQALQP